MNNYFKYLIIILLLIIASDHNFLNCKFLKKVKKEMIKKSPKSPKSKQSPKVKKIKEIIEKPIEQVQSDIPISIKIKIDPVQVNFFKSILITYSL
jgi:hypothetical protein